MDAAQGTGLCVDSRDGKVMAVSAREDGNSTVCWFGSLVSGLILVFSLLANLLLKFFLLTLSGAPQCNVNWNSAGCRLLEVAVLFINIFDKVVGGGGGGS